VIDALGQPQSMLLLGGTSDIGLATVRAMAPRRLQRAVLAGRDLAALEAAAVPLRESGLAVEVEAFDALAADEHQSWVTEVFDRHGGFDVALLAFGVLGDQQAAEDDVAEALRVVRTNFVGAVGVGLPLVQRMMADGHGVVVVLSSVAGVRVRRANFVYGASKAALDAFAQGLGDLAHGTVRVVVVRPGFVRGRMTAGMKAAPFATTPEAVADTIVGALAGRAEVVYSPSVLRYLFAVLRSLPRPVFRRLPLS
jgi:decaprenylphospho-beta-D-erythro-pentofuranosid-2-ulose 2-reductase